MRRHMFLPTVFLLVTTIPTTTGDAACPAEHQGLGTIEGESPLFGSFSLFVIGDWTDACERPIGCADSARGSVHGLEGFPVGPFQITELGNFAIGCVVDCAFPAFGIVYRGPGGGVFPGVDENGDPIVTFDCPGGFQGEMRRNAF